MLNDSEQYSIHRAGQSVTPPSPSIVPGPDRPGGGFFVMGSGWIKLHRGITDHWIWSDPVKLKWWLDLLLMVNHEPKKVLIGGTLIECGRGQTVRSLNTFSEKWLVTKKTVKTFLELLQSDDMIRIENVKISTRITICNYEYYQDSVNGKETTGKRQVNAKETPSKRELPPNKNDKEREERKECKEGEEGIISGEKKSPVVYKGFISTYDSFVKKLNNAPAKIDSVQGSFAKKIIAYLSRATKDRNQEAGDAEILAAWQFILDQYDNWGAFYQEKIRLQDIYTNLENIIRAVKNGRQQRGQKELADKFAEVDRIVDAVFGNQPVQ